MSHCSFSFLSKLLFCGLFIQAYTHAIGNSGRQLEMGLVGTNAANITRKGHLPLDVDGYPVAPSELVLQQVHMYVRHGERSPVSVRMADPPANLPASWMFCHAAQQFRAAVADAGSKSGDAEPDTLGIMEARTSTEERRACLVVERADGAVAPGECLLGELTDVGRESTSKLGASLRKLYVERLKFLPEVVKSNEEIYLRSTNIPRTIESLQQIVRGLYPLTKSAKGFVPQLRIRNTKDENLFANTAMCRRLQILQIGFAQAAATIWNTALEPLDKQISKYIGGKPVRLDGQPRASGILDTIRAANAHNVKVPKEFHEPGVIDVIEQAVVDEWFADRTEEVRRLGMGPLLSDLAGKMQNKVEKGEVDPTKILIHSTHDTCLAGLSGALQIFDEKWPPFTAAITFELFKKHGPATRSYSTWQSIMSILGGAQDNSEHYVRVRYQNQNKVLPFCAQDGKHLPGFPEFCTLTAFRERVKELTPTDWEAECAYTPRGSRQNDLEEVRSAAAAFIVKP